jgi:hypothetical protein
MGAYESRAGAMSGPRYGGRGRSKCMIRNELTRAVTASNVLPDRPQHARAGPVRLAPRPAPRGGHWPGGAPPSPRGPPALTSRSSWARVRRRSRCRNATLAAGRADRERDRLASSNEPRALSNFVKPVRRDAAAAAAQRLADLRALRDDQRAKEAEVAALEAEHRQRPMRTDGLPHACGVFLSGCGPASAVCCTPVVARMLLERWQVGAKAECGGRCLGGGRLGQRLHVVKLL